MKNLFFPPSIFPFFSWENALESLLFSIKMKFVMHFFGNISNLECKRLVISDTNLMGIGVEKSQ